MSKWVDADEILRYLDRLSNSGLGKQKTLEYLTKYINKQSTEIDVEKIVEQVDEKSQLARPVGWVYPYEIILTKDVMKIVKEGGIDENRNI